MEYHGKLYGRMNGKYFDTGKNTEDYDNLVKKNMDSCSIHPVIRQPLLSFTEYQEKVLKDNDHKGGWEEILINILLDMLKDEVRELEEMVYFFLCKNEKYGGAENSKKECADVANFAMMIFDNIKRSV